MVKTAMPKPQQKLDKMSGGAGRTTIDVEENEEEEGEVMVVVDVVDLSASNELYSQVVAEMTRGQKAIYPIRSSHNADFRELVNEEELMIRESSLESSALVLGDSAYYIRSGRKEIIALYDVLTSEGKADAVALCK